tara:strand:+ start:142222 stop:142650 length:429 start_codon:yes stop_codon:yes gene_type:complete
MPKMAGQYKGDVTPEEALDMLAKDKNTVLVDVRTLAEWKCVGVVDLSDLSKDNILIEWVSFPDGTPNADFLSQLNQAVPAKETTICFLCRTGVRSVGAAIAATEAGFENSYNILQGFEGGPDEHGHRGRISGWQGLDLPWKH